MDTTQQSNSSNDDLLVTWKDIAAYLKCSVRKAQRLESHNLPVHRITGTKSIWASKGQIDRWLMVQAEAARHTQTNVTTPQQTGVTGRVALWLLGIWIGLTVVSAFKSAYGLTIVSFGISVMFVVLAYPSFRDSSLTRALVAFFVIAGMSYCATATTLPDLISSVLNMRTLRPALAYPFLAGLRFIPIPILIAVMLVCLAFGDVGFAHRLRFRYAYLLLGMLLLLVVPIAGVNISGAYRVWQAGLPIRWTLLAGESFVLGVNVLLFVAGYRIIHKAAMAKSYRALFAWYGIGYLVIALSAAILNHHWNEIDKYYLDVLHPQDYRAQSPNPFDDFHDWLAQHAAEAGPELVGLSDDQEFFGALKSQNFYKQDFDESLQATPRALIFGYKADDGLRHRHQSMFVRIRLPASLVEALRFEPVKH